MQFILNYVKREIKILLKYMIIVNNLKRGDNMRRKLYKDYITTTLKLERRTMEDFTNFLNGKSKNSYIVEKISELKDFFARATENDKIDFLVNLMPYASRRKLTGADVEIEKRKECVVSVKCEKEDYEVVVSEAGKLGLSFSEIIRRIIIRDIEKN